MVVAYALGIFRVETVVREILRVRIEPIEAAVECPDPYVAGPVDQKREDMVVDEAVRILGIVAKDGEGVAVVPVQPVLGTEPHETTLVLGDALDDGLGQTLLEG